MATKGIKILLLATLALCVTGAAQSAPNYSPFASAAEYEEKLAALEGFLRYYGKRGTNTLYVARLEANPEEKERAETLYAYWREGRSILILSHFAPGARRDDYAWVAAKAVIDLRTDVVPTDHDIGGSNYLVSKPWVDRIVNGCLKGRKIVLMKSK
jgi:hypothetical protein